MIKNGTVKYFLELIIVLLLSAQAEYAQDSLIANKQSELRSLLRLTAGWHNGLEWEKRIGEKSTISLFGGMLINLATDGFSISDFFRVHWQVSPDACVEYRYYYNLFKRINKHKRTINNSANFLYGQVESIFPVKNQNFLGLLFTQGWGMQRVLYKKFMVSYHIGISEHIYYDRPPSGGFNYVKLEPFGELSVSYIF